MYPERKTTGTFKIEGMLQGPMPTDGSFQAKVDAWMASVREKGLTFNLDCSGGQFSMLAEVAIYPCDKIAQPGALAETLQATFENLLGAFPVEMRMSLFSTLRSVEYRPGSEVQTIYAIAPPGAITVQERVVDADTVAPPPQLTPQGKLKIAAIGVVTALALAAIAFMVFRPQLQDAADKLTELKPEDIELETTRFDRFITITKTKIDKREGGLVVEIKKGERWAETIGAADAPAPSDLDWETLLATQSLRRGYIRCELFDKNGTFIASADLRLHPLLATDKETTTSSILLPRKTKAAKISLMY